METEQEIDLKIINLINQIEEQHPELLKYLNEMPVTIPDENDPHINVKILKDYYDSIQVVLRTYAKEHLHKFNE